MTKEDIQALFKAIDSFDTKEFITYLHEDCAFQFGNMPVIRGKNDIFEFVAGFFQAIRDIRHTNLEIWSVDDVRFVNGSVTYTRLNGTTLTVNLSKTFKLEDGRIKEYLIFIDNHELFKEA